MNKLYLLIGKSGSGKSTLESAIVNWGLAERVVSTTTRKKRSYEIDHEHYHFISEMVFATYLAQDQYIEYSKYPMVSGMAYYGINKNDIKLDEYPQVAVVNPQGAEKLIAALGDKVVTIYIDRDDKERIISALKRDTNDFENTLEEVYRRYKADKIDFKDIRHDADYTIKNEGSIEDMVKVFNKIMERESLKNE